MSFKPAFTAILRARKSATDPDPLGVIFDDAPCAFWFSSGRTLNRRGTQEPPIMSQVAVGRSSFIGASGWAGNPPVWNAVNALLFQVRDGIGDIASVHPVFGTIMWNGTPDEHIRYDCTIPTAATLTTPPFLVQRPIGTNGAPLPPGVQVLFDLYRPFSSGSPLSIGHVGIFYSDVVGGRDVSASGASSLWDGILDTLDSVDIRDGSARAAGLDFTSYGDGDKVVFTTAMGSSPYVVVRVSRIADVAGGRTKRVYLLRDVPVWPGP